MEMKSQKEVVNDFVRLLEVMALEITMHSLISHWWGTKRNKLNQ